MAKLRKPLFLDGGEVYKYLNLDLKELINKIEHSFVQYTSKVEGVVQPPRMFLPLRDQNFFLVKPAYSLPDKTLSTKLLTLYPDNEKMHGLPGLQSIVTIFDSDNGSLQAVMDGTSITDLRTAAASAVGVKHLSTKGSSILAIIGTGHQGATHVKLMRELKQFNEIRVFSRTKERRDEFAKLWEVTACDSVEDTVKNADVVVTATSSKTAVLFHTWMKHNALVIIVGAPEPTAREVDDDIMLNSQVITDSLVDSNCGDVMLSSATVHGELGDVIIGKLKPDFDKMRVFKSNGMAIQDLVAGRIVVDNYLKANK